MATFEGLPDKRFFTDLANYKILKSLSTDKSHEFIYHALQIKHMVLDVC